MQVIIIYAVTNNYLKDIDVKNIADYQIQLFDYIDNSYPEIIDSIKVTKELTAETENALKEALTLFADKYIADEK